MLKAKLDKEAEESYRKPVDFDEFEYTTDSLTSTFKARQKTKDTVKVRPDYVWDRGCREVVKGRQPR